MKEVKTKITDNPSHVKKLLGKIRTIKNRIERDADTLRFLHDELGSFLEDAECGLCEIESGINTISNAL